MLCGRLKPAKVNLLDIDRFGEDQYVILDFEEMPREKRERLTFELSEEIKGRVAPLLKEGEKAKEPSETRRKLIEKEKARNEKREMIRKVDQILNVVNERIADLVIQGDPDEDDFDDPDEE